jgi:hypothetical protein
MLESGVVTGFVAGLSIGLGFTFLLRSKVKPEQQPESREKNSDEDQDWETESDEGATHFEFEFCNIFTKLEFVCVLVKLKPGANPTIASYNASVVNVYNATGSLACFENKNILVYAEKTLKPTTTLAL